MAITVSGRKMNVTPAIKDYVDEKIGRALEVFDSAAMDAEVVLRTEKNPAISLNAICEVTVNAKGAVIRVAESAEDMYAAIDVAAAKVVRQLRKYKTKVVDRKLRAADETIRMAEPAAAGELDVDGLMQELAADDEVVRVKTIEFEPLTEEEALVKIDLLGHDFFAYTDRDSGMVNVLYRRDDGGYGLLKQTEE